MSHIGTNPETQRQLNAGETIVELIPQGTLAERVRAAGLGVGGFLTPTGVGTEVEAGKQVLDYWRPSVPSRIAPSRRFGHS